MLSPAVGRGICIRVGVEMHMQERRNPALRGALLERAEKEFAELPGLRLSGTQASRLWSVRPDVSERLLRALVRKGILSRGADGIYYRRNSNM